MDKLKKINLVKREVASGSYYGFNLGKKLVEQICPKGTGIYITFAMENNSIVVKQISRDKKGSYRFEKTTREVIFINIPSDIAPNFIGKDFLLDIQDGFLEIKENKHLKKITESMQLDKKVAGPAKEKKSNENIDIDKAAKEIKDFLLENGQGEVQILSMNKFDEEVA